VQMHIFIPTLGQAIVTTHPDNKSKIDDS
jgi:hypothetical protein